MKIYSDITKTIGKTPLIKMLRIGSDLPATILLKLEFFNPLSSVKDRIGLNMIEVAERTGKLKKGMRVLEPTSGNTGIALAFVCASKGYPLTLVMPETMSMERRTLLLLLGAELILTPAAFGIKGSVAKALELSENQADIFVPSQFENPANIAIHQETTALEIWNDTDGTIDYLISGVGTGGTLTGVASIIKQKKASLKVVAVEPKESSVISGNKPGPHKIQGLGAGFIPQNLDTKYIDEIIQISSEESIECARKVIKTEGIPVGISSGAAILAALQIGARPENKGKVIVAIIPSSSERYLSTLLAAQESEKAKNLVTTQINEEYLKKVK